MTANAMAPIAKGLVQTNPDSSTYTVPNYILRVGAYAQDTVTPNSDGPYIGVNALTVWSYDALGEAGTATAAGGLVAPANSGTVAGKTSRYVTTAASPMTVSADQTCAVTAGGTVTAGAAQAYKTYLPVGTVVPANSWMHVFLV